MKLLYINDAIAIFGGLERILVDKMNMLAEEGYEVYLITTNQGQHDIAYPLNPKVTHYDLNIRFHLEYQFFGIKRLYKRFQLQNQFYRCLSKKICEIGPDVIICTRIEMMSTVTKANGSIPLVFESHLSCLAGYFQQQKKWKLMYANFLNRYAKNAQVVVTLTEGDAKDWRKINKNVAVVPNLVHLNKTGHYSDGQSKSVIFVGRFTEQKDIDSLLRIWQKVYTYHSDWHLHIFGGYGGQYERIIEEISIMDSNIIVHKPTSEILTEYTRHSILLLTSRFEPFGLVLPEAMSCGLPVVAFDCPYGPADIISNGVDGFLIPGRDENLFVEKVCWLIEHPEERLKMGKSGIQSSQRYVKDKIFPLWKQLFEHLCYNNQ